MNATTPRRTTSLSIGVLCALVLAACGGGQAIGAGDLTTDGIGKPCKKEGDKADVGTESAVCVRRETDELVWKLVERHDGGSTSPDENTTKPVLTGDTNSWKWADASSTYVPTGTPPECPTNLIGDGGLVDFDGIRSKAMPGQPRDGEYLFYGTLRWSSQGQPFPDDVTVRMPFDGYVTSAWQFLNGGNYLFGLEVVHPCGLMVYLSKMRTPGPDVQSKVLASLPEATEKNSQGTFFEPGIWLTTGTVLATSVGVSPPAQADLIGAQLDFGIVDLRSKNPQIPSDFNFAQWTNAAPQTVFWGRCAWDYLSASDRAKLDAIPLLGNSPSSDTCTTP